MASVAQTYTVPEENVSGLVDRVGKLAKRAAKLGMAPIAVTVSSDYVKTVEIKDEISGMVKRVICYRAVTISGEQPKLNGWLFVGSLQHIDGVEGNVIRTIPGMNLPEAFRTAKSECEHCKTNRRRKDTFVVLNDEGIWRQVGRNCLEDFLGHADPHKVAAYAELLHAACAAARSAEDEEGFGGSWTKSPEFVSLVTFLAYTNAAIRKFGWLSRAKARAEGGQDTANRAWVSLFPPKDLSESAKGELAEADDQDVGVAKAAADWAEEVLVANSDYEHNLKVVCGNGSGALQARCIGIAASLVPAYKRWLGEQEQKKHGAGGKHFGEVGKRAVFVLTVVALRSFEGSFGPTTIVVFKDKDGNEAKWFATGEAKLEIGKTYNIRGTVKKHDEYKGVAQTVLNRCKVESQTSFAAVAA